MRNENFNFLLEIVFLVLFFMVLFFVAAIGIVAFNIVQYELTGDAPELPESVRTAVFTSRGYLLFFLVYFIPATLLAFAAMSIQFFLRPEMPPVWLDPGEGVRQHQSEGE
jgi:hypothetical protein